jgi:hypothetical protein
MLIAKFFYLLKRPFRLTLFFCLLPALRYIPQPISKKRINIMRRVSKIKKANRCCHKSGIRFISVQGYQC